MLQLTKQAEKLLSLIVTHERLQSNGKEWSQDQPVLEQELHACTGTFFGILLDTVNNEAFTHAKVF